MALSPFFSRTPRRPRRTVLFSDTSPRVVSVTPNSARVAGGVTVTISGYNFETDSAGVQPTVLFGTVPATSVTVVDKNTITAVAPAHASGLTDVTVINWHNQPAVLEQSFIYVQTTVISIAPNYGPLVGGTTVILTVANLDVGAPTVLFGGVSATSITRIDAQHVSAITPSGLQGPVDVQVNDAILRGGFFYTLLTPGEDIRRNPSVNIRERINQPATCTFTVDGRSAPPQAGEEFEFRDDNDNLLFAGVVQMVEQSFEELGTNIVWNVTCTDYTTWLNRRRPIDTFTGVSASSVIPSLIAKYAPWVTTNHVQADLPAVTLDLDGQEDFASVLTNIAQQVGGGYWYLDYTKDLHFIQTTLNSSGNSTPIVGVGGGDVIPTPVTVVASGTAASYAEGYYSFAASFVYSNGVESSRGPWSTPVLLDGTRVPTINNIPTGGAIGSLTVTKRRLYYRFFGLQTGVVDEAFVEINDNTTTSITSVGTTAAFRSPRLPKVVPPPAPPFAPGVDESDSSALSVAASMFPSIAFWAAYTYEPGTYAFVITDVYDDGTESLPSPMSDAILLDGFHAVSLNTRDRLRTINGRSVIYSKVYASISDVTGTPPTFDKSSTSFWTVIPGNANVTTLIIPGLHDIPVSTGITQQSYPPEPFTAIPISSVGKPDDIDDANTSLLLDPPIRRTVDVTQLRNRVVVLGKAEVQSPPYVAPVDVDTPAIEAPSTDAIPPATSAATTPRYTSDSTIYYLKCVGTLSTSETGVTQPPRGFPLNSRWYNIVNNEFPAAGRAASSGGTTVPPWWRGNSPGGISFPPPNVPQSVGVGTLFDYIRNKYGITKEYASAHPYTVFQDLPDNFDFRAWLPAGDPVPATPPPTMGIVPSRGSAAAVSRTNTDPPKVVRPRYQVDDEDSQRYMGRLELDSNGNPTDGIHEVVISTDFTRAEDCIAFGKAQLAQFAWPLIRVEYATRDPKSHPGQFVHIDLSHPPINGDFLITEVSIDQIKDEAETTNDLTPRYNVVAADPSKFNLDDLLLLIGGNGTDSLAFERGLNPQMLAAARAAAKAYTDTATAATTGGGEYPLMSVELTLSNSQIETMFTTPILIVPGKAGVVIQPYVLVVYNDQSLIRYVTATSIILQWLNGVYTGSASQALGPSGPIFNNTLGERRLWYLRPNWIAQATQSFVESGSPSQSVVGAPLYVTAGNTTSHFSDPTPTGSATLILIYQEFPHP